MNNVLELTNLLVKGKRIERVSGHLASKVRLTPATAISFRKNIDTGLVKNAIEKYNATYAELRNAVVSAEVALAEQEARDKALVNPSVQKEEAARTARIEEDNTVAKLTSPHLVKRRFNILSIEVDKLAGRFGTLGKNFGVNVKKGYSPKALSIPSLYSKIYSGISRKSDIYKLADQLIDADPNLLHSQGEEQKVPIANWRSLFANSDVNKTSQLNVVTDEREEKEEELFVPVESKGLTKEELSHRKLMGQVGDELQEIRKIEISPNGIVSPFNNGLIERENSLLSMLSNLSGVESIAKRKTIVNSRKDNTEFQNLIDRIVGYKDPISDEEHKKKEESLQQYYSNPEVSEIIDNLRHKDMLFTFNQPDSYKKIMEAERKDNERKATLSTTIDILDSEDDLIDTIPEKVEKNSTKESQKEVAMEQLVQPVMPTKQEIETLEASAALQNSEREKETKKLKEEAEREKERQQLIVGAEEQARILQQQIEQDNLILGAEEQARMLQKENERIELIEGAQEQARMLKTLYDFIDKQEEMAKIAEQEKKQLVEGAQEQAKILQQQNEKIELTEGAKEQARILQQQNEKIELTEGAQEQARILQQQNEKIELTESAKEQARILQQENEKIELVEGAQEQARLLQRKNEYIDLMDSAQIQAQMLNEKPDEVDTMEELASQIVYQNTNVDEDDMKVGAEEQAQLLQEKNEHADLINGAEVQAKMLYSSVKNQTKTIEQRLGSNVQLLDNTDRYSNIVSASKPIKLRQTQMKNLNDSLKNSLSITLEKKKELLNSLKQQIQEVGQEEMSFLKYNENLVKTA